MTRSTAFRLAHFITKNSSTRKNGLYRATFAAALKAVLGGVKVFMFAKVIITTQAVAKSVASEWNVDAENCGDLAVLDCWRLNEQQVCKICGIVNQHIRCAAANVRTERKPQPRLMVAVGSVRIGDRLDGRVVTGLGRKWYSRCEDSCVGGPQGGGWVQYAYLAA